MTDDGRSDMSDAALVYDDWTASLEVREDIATPTMVGNLAAALDREPVAGGGKI